GDQVGVAAHVPQGSFELGFIACDGALCLGDLGLDGARVEGEQEIPFVDRRAVAEVDPGDFAVHARAHRDCLDRGDVSQSLDEYWRRPPHGSGHLNRHESYGRWRLRFRAPPSPGAGLVNGKSNQGDRGRPDDQCACPHHRITGPAPSYAPVPGLPQLGPRQLPTTLHECALIFGPAITISTLGRASGKLSKLHAGTNLVPRARSSPNIPAAGVERAARWWRTSELDTSRLPAAPYLGHRRPPPLSTLDPLLAMRVATWNVNSIKQRVDSVVAWLQERAPDIACLQEIKCVDEAFPREPFEALGYNIKVHGQKGFNGVAVLSKLPFDETTPRLPGGDDDDHARFLESALSTKSGALRIASLYLPNGNPPDTHTYPYTLKWMDRLITYAQGRL